MFPKNRLEAMTANLRTYGSQFGLQFNNLEVLSNSHLSLIAGEFAKDRGKFHEYHEAAFKAYFTDGEDIGKVEVISRILEKLNLDAKEFMSAAKEGIYEDRLEQTTRAAHENQINSTPTFIINDKYAIVGAQPVESFRKTLLEISSSNH
jgi:predicted DsbA family dithiol-disulfide isomerase